MITRLRRALSALLRKDALRKELDEEMAFHLDELARDLMRQGMAPDAARREARRRFGLEERTHEGVREALGLAWLDEAARNVRFAWRGMRRNAVLTLTFLVTLSLCIGFGMATFAAVDAVLWQPLPYPESERLAVAGLHDPSREDIPLGTGVDGATWFAIRDGAEGFQTAVYSGWPRGVNLSGLGAAQFVVQQRVGAGFFETLGVNPLMGREFTRAEDQPDGPNVAVLSHRLWSDALGADPDILGNTIRLKGELHTVVGVMPEGFRSDVEAEVWTPLRPSTSGEGSGSNYNVLVRLPRGMVWEEARARFSAIDVPLLGEGAPTLLAGLLPLGEARTGPLRVPLLVLLGATGLMILVGFFNLAGIQVSRAVTREGELATRRALGGGRGSLTRQILTENLLLGGLGALLALGVAVVSLDGLEAFLTANLGTLVPMRMEGRGLLVGAGLALLATVVFGLTPMIQVGRQRALRLVAGGTRGVVGSGSGKVRRALLVGQVCLVTVLLFAAVLLARSYGALAGLAPGFDPRGVLSVQVSLDDARFADVASVDALFTRTLAEIEAMDGVASAAVALSLPYERPLNTPFSMEGDEDRRQPRLTNVVYVTPEYFETMGIPIRAGRGTSETDGTDSPPVVVASEGLVAANFPQGAGVGARILLAGDRVSREVVGIAGDVQQAGGGWGSADPVWAAPTLYLPVTQLPDALLRQVHVWFSPSWVVRGDGTAPGLPSALGRTFENLDAELPVARTASLEEVIAGSFAGIRFQATFLMVVAGFALLLAGVGLYGIVSQEVVERRREMGIRMALGATPGGAALTAGLAGVRLAAVGLVLGAVGTAGAGRVVASLLWGVEPWDPATVFALVGGIGALAIVASFVPAARVARLDPTTALRE